MTLSFRAPMPRNILRITRGNRFSLQSALNLHRAAIVSLQNASGNGHLSSSSCQAFSTSQLGTSITPALVNEPVPNYAPRSSERVRLVAEADRFLSTLPRKPELQVAGRALSARSGQGIQYSPEDHSLALVEYPYVSPSEVDSAISATLAAKGAWQSLPFADRAAVFLKAADLITGKYRTEMLLSTMLGQGKTIFQAEIDSAAELADFLRFNVKYAEELYSKQTTINAPGVWNRQEYRPLEGFVYAVTPFNFTAIAGNLPCAPALMGNVVVWKPSPHAMLSNLLLHKILLESGLPPDVIQFLPTDDPAGVSKKILSHPDFAALHFTGSTAVFRQMYGTIANGIADGSYRTFPRVIGETGGKNFHIVHRDADLPSAARNTVRAAFEYGGQKCSACSRAYVSSQAWPEFRAVVEEEMGKIQQGSVLNLENFVGPVIHKQSFEKCAGIIDRAKDDATLSLISGGTYDSSKGWFVQSTVYQTTDINHELLNTEIFGPILVVYVYPDDSTGDDLSSLTGICQQVDKSSTYALTGSIFARSRTAIRLAEEELRQAAGNFYINSKCTGAVVGQQPFGGARASGTNDKAGSAAFLGRFVSPRAIKEEFEPLAAIGYPHMHQT